MRTLITLITILMLVGCGSLPRTKHTDKNLRVMVDPDSIDTNNQVRIQQALVANGKFIVVDRGAGYQALKKEQERLHRKEGSRFEDREKWSLWGKLYGVGAIITAHAQCQRKKGLFSSAKYMHCQQSIAIINSNTGEIIATAQGEANSDINEYTIAPEWTDTVDALADNYPEIFEPNRDHKVLEDYRQLSSESAQRQKEVLESSKKVTNEN